MSNSRTCSTNEKCPIWGTKAETKNCQSEKTGTAVDSARTGGKYFISEEAKHLARDLSDKQKARLTSWMINQRFLGIECPEVDRRRIEEEDYGQALKVHERAGCLLRLLELESPEIGKFISFNTDSANGIYPKMLAWSESTEAGEVHFLLDQLKERGWIKRDGRTVWLTMDGYIRLEELDKAERDSSKAFVAMWFDESMSKAWERGIEPAITKSGYDPVRIDQIKHNDKIDDRIIAEIRRSRFVVADFTHGKDGARGGVYYEAGFAHGLGLEVFFTCHEDMVDKMHFDTRQYNHIVWNEPEDLKKTLADRISAVIGDGPKKSNEEAIS